MAELFESFGLAMATGVLCIYVVLVLLFKDFVQPATIPRGAGAVHPGRLPGAVRRAVVAVDALDDRPDHADGHRHQNSILLIDYVVLARREHGLNRWEALLDACRKRARPIVMTTIAMGAGMTPIALGLGVDPSFRAPMAIVVIGGLITSTFLSLLVIPVVAECERSRRTSRRCCWPASSPTSCASRSRCPSSTSRRWPRGPTTARKSCV